MSSRQLGKKNGTCIFITNLSFSTTEDKLSAEFSRFGLLKGVVIVRSHKTGDSKGFAYVTYNDPESSARAIQTMNNKMIDGRPVKVEESVTETRMLSDIPVKERPARRILSPKRIDVPYRAPDMRSHNQHKPYDYGIQRSYYEEQPHYPTNIPVEDIGEEAYYPDRREFIEPQNTLRAPPRELPSRDFHNSLEDPDVYSDYDYRPKQEYNQNVPIHDPRINAYINIPPHKSSNIPPHKSSNIPLRQNSSEMYGQIIPQYNDNEYYEANNYYDNSEPVYPRKPYSEYNSNNYDNVYQKSSNEINLHDNERVKIAYDSRPYLKRDDYEGIEVPYDVYPEPVNSYNDNEDPQKYRYNESYRSINEPSVERDPYFSNTQPLRPAMPFPREAGFKELNADPCLNRIIDHPAPQPNYPVRDSGYKDDSFFVPPSSSQREQYQEPSYRPDPRLLNTRPPFDQRNEQNIRYPRNYPYSNNRLNHSSQRGGYRSVPIKPEKDIYERPLAFPESVEWPNEQPVKAQAQNSSSQQPSTLRWKTNSDVKTNVSEQIGSAKARLDSYKNLMNDVSQDSNANINANPFTKPLNSNNESKNASLDITNLKNFTPFEKDLKRNPIDRNI